MFILPAVGNTGSPFPICEENDLTPTPDPNPNPDEDKPAILFVRGADRSSGFLEAHNDASHTEHLSDIYNKSTKGGNHDWHELRVALEKAGFAPNQI